MVHTDSVCDGKECIILVHMADGERGVKGSVYSLF